ncbi:MAG: thioredoxin family protein [Flavobacteriales bacterium]|nr:thioredoxin family protein [Flavobacteriales bacterium]
MSTKVSIDKYMASGMDYESYVELSEKLVSEGRSTAIEDSEVFVKYAKLNVHRMNRVGKTVQLNNQLLDAVKSISAPMKWLVLSESWCGDAAQNLPILSMIAESTDQIQLRVLLRDQNLELMDQFLTNGGRSIPKLIASTAQGDVIFSWGPRPATPQKMVSENKASGAKSYDELAVEIHKWYAKDKGQELQEEFLQLFKKHI